MLAVDLLTVGAYQENTYVVYNEDRQALIIDPGDESDRLIQWIKDNQWQPQAILTTHTHIDHISAVDALRDEFGIEAYVHKIEEQTFQTPDRNFVKSDIVVNRPADHLWETNGLKTVGSFSFETAHIPGHSPGHLVFIFKEAGFVICGDTVFRGSIGRTDMPDGDVRSLLLGIGQELLSLDGETVLYPGHGPATTVGYEYRTNPFLEVFRRYEKEE
ncbi:MBL fold metallo-hydrolase [Aerococcaceae bacterium WGS1372]